MIKIQTILALLITGLFILNCSTVKFVSVDEAKPQSSVKISLTDGSIKEGIIFKGDGKQLFYVDATSHKTDTIQYAKISQVEYLDKYFDYDGYEMPNAEIKSHKSPTKTILYGAGGFVLGVAAGTGLSVAFFGSTEENPEGNRSAAISTITGFGALGAATFGWMGSKIDLKDAVFKARKSRYAKVKQDLDKKKAELEELKRQKGLK